MTALIVGYRAIFLRYRASLISLYFRVGVKLLLPVRNPMLIAAREEAIDDSARLLGIQQRGGRVVWKSLQLLRFRRET